MTTTTSNITYYDGQTVTVQGLQMRARSYNLPNVIGDNEYAIDFMKGTDWAYAQNGAIDFASSVYHEPDMTFDRPVIDDYGRIFVYDGIYKASLSNNGVVLAQQLYDVSTHRLGASNIYLYDYVDTKDIFVRKNVNTSNIATSNLNVSLNATVVGSITANSFIGDGSGLTGLNIPPQTWSSNVANAKIWYNTGNVGIGTSNPSQNLEVVGTVKATSFQGDGSGLTNLPSVSSQWTTNGTSIYYNIGNIGVGTTTPTQSIDVNGNVKANYFIGDGSLLTNLPNGGGGLWSCNVNGDIYYTAGNVGIGINNPAVALSVNGTTSTTTLRTSIFETTSGLLTIKPQTTPTNCDLKIDSGGTGNRNAIYFRGKEAFRSIDSEALLRINDLGNFTNVAITNGNVGIGTTIPTQKLDVNGNARITGSLLTPSIKSTTGVVSIRNNTLSGGSTLRLGEPESGYNELTIGGKIGITYDPSIGNSLNINPNNDFDNVNIKKLNYNQDDIQFGNKNMFNTNTTVISCVLYRKNSFRVIGFVGNGQNGVGAVNWYSHSWFSLPYLPLNEQVVLQNINGYEYLDTYIKEIVLQTYNIFIVQTTKVYDPVNDVIKYRHSVYGAGYNSYYQVSSVAGEKYRFTLSGTDDYSTSDNFKLRCSTAYTANVTTVGYIDTNGQTFIRGVRADNGGTGTFTSFTQIPYNSMLYISVSGLQDLLINNTFMIGLTTDGYVIGNGANNGGVLGQNNTTDSLQAWLPVMTTNIIPFPLSNIVKIFMGTHNSRGLGTIIALNDTGKLFSWGANNYGSCGLGNTTNPSLRAQQITALNAEVVIDVGICGGNTGGTSYSVVAITQSGKVFTWGYGDVGIGHGNTTSLSTPTEVTTFRQYGGLGFTNIDRYIDYFPTTFVKCFAFGNLNQFWILDDKGRPWGVGRNNYGGLGIGDDINATYFTQVVGLPEPVVDICCANRYNGTSVPYTTYFKLASGRIYACGNNDYNNLPLTNSMSACYIPIEVPLMV